MFLQLHWTAKEDGHKVVNAMMIEECPRLSFQEVIYAVIHNWTMKGADSVPVYGVAVRRQGGH